MVNQNSFSSRHFRLEQLADGVYAAIHAEGGWAVCNAGIIDLGDRTVVYDAFMTPVAARDLRQAAESLTGQPVHAVINSHYHNDHIWGNQVFSAGADIISSTQTRKLIIKEGALEIQGYRASAQQTLSTIEESFKVETDNKNRNQLKILVDYFQAILATLPELEIRLPNLTFTDDMILEGSSRSARLITFAGGHCGSDTILHLPQDGIVFMEDLLFVDVHPYLADGDPDALQQILAQVRKLGATKFVPGHGPVGDARHLDWMDTYIGTLNLLVREAISRGMPEVEIDQIPMPEEYQDLVYPNFFPANLKFLYKRQSG